MASVSDTPPGYATSVGVVCAVPPAPPSWVGCCLRSSALIELVPQAQGSWVAATSGTNASVRSDWLRHRRAGKRLRLADLLANGPETGLARAEELYSGPCAEDLEDERWAESSTWHAEELSREGQVEVRVGRALPLDILRNQTETRSTSRSVRHNATWLRRTGARSMSPPADRRRMHPGRGSSKHRPAPRTPQTAAQHTRALQGTWDRLSRLTALLSSTMCPGPRTDPTPRGGSTGCNAYPVG